MSDLLGVLLLYLNPAAAWPFWLAALVAASMRHGQRWLFVGGLTVSLLGCTLAWRASPVDGGEFLEISDRDFLLVLTVWWTATWLPGVLVGAAIRRATTSVRSERPREAPPAHRRARTSERTPPSERDRPVDRDLRAALAPYGVGIAVRRGGD